MKLSVHVWNFDYPDAPGSIAPELDRVSGAAEAAGLHALSVMDHYFQMDNVAPVEQPMLEGYTTLAYLAARTSSVQLRTLVTGATYRHPGLLAKIISTLDVLSGGRAELGIGAAWYEREHTGLGVPFPPVAERFERLDEALQICKQMWDPDNNGPFKGRYYQLGETLSSPTTISRPHPPVMIGGGGERKTLRLVARHADASNLIVATPTEVVQKLDVLRRHCDELGRDEATIRKTILYTGGALARGDIDGFSAEMADFARVGIDEVTVIPATDQPAAWVETACAEAAPRLAELQP